MPSLLQLRMRAHYENALAIAQFLEKNELVEKVSRISIIMNCKYCFPVLYPALPSHPQHDIHKKQTTGMSGMMSFYLKGGKEEAQRFFEAIKVILINKVGT